MGRNKLPDNVKVMRGTAQPCRLTGGQNFELATGYTIPAHLDKDAKKVFKSIAERMLMNRLLSTLDFEQLEIYAINYARCVKAEKMIKMEGEVVLIKDEDGNLLRQEENVWLKIQKDAIKVINAIGGQFGMSPVSRVKLASLLKAEKEQKDDFSEYDEL